MMICYFTIIVFVLCVHGWNIPGMMPTDYDESQYVPLFVNKLSSTKTQITYDYYLLPFCRPDVLKTAKENIGQIFSGDRVRTSPYSFHALKDSNCKQVCVQNIDRPELLKLEKFIRDEYRVNMLMDELPIAEKFVQPMDIENFYYKRGYPVGGETGSNTFLNNHLFFTIKYHKTGSLIRIIAVEVLPSSINHSYDGDKIKNCDDKTILNADMRDLRIDTSQVMKIGFSYSTRWIEEPNIAWASRWDIYLKNVPGAEVQWITVANSIFIAIFLTIIVAFILIRTVYRDVARYNSYLPLQENTENVLEESGWKLVHGDIFRPPQYFPLYLSSIVGSGVQLFVMSFIIISFMCLGLISPSSRGSLFTASLLLFILFGCVSGYYSAKIYKYFKGKKWKRLTFFTSLFFPGMIFTISLFVNIFLSNADSTQTIPFSSIIYLLIAWLGISAPLVFVGAFLGFKSAEYDLPCKTTQIPRPIPPQPLYLHQLLTLLSSGLLTFSSIFLELKVVMGSLWLHQVFAVFGLLFIVYFVGILAISEISIVFCYFQLIHEDYVWAWRSVFNSGSIAIFIFIYSMIYASKLHLSSITSFVIYYGVMSAASLLVATIASSIGFMSCFWFNRKIYSSIKID